MFLHGTVNQGNWHGSEGRTSLTNHDNNNWSASFDPINALGISSGNIDINLTAHDQMDNKASLERFNISF